MDKKDDDIRAIIEKNEELYKILCDNSLLDSVIDIVVEYSDKAVDVAFEFSKNITLQLLGKKTNT